MSETARISSRVPRTAAWLGVLGVIPFAAGSFLLLLDTHGHSLVASYLLIAYGAVILSFLGAVHWGLAAGIVEMADDIDQGADLITAGA